jgi:putative transposase
MPRTARAVAAGGLYHVLNRGNGRQEIFHKPEDFRAFLRVLAEGLERYPVDLLCYCLMPNHWHLVLRPRTRPALGRLMGWVGVTHVRRHQEHYHDRGGGHLYQGRFKSFPIQDDRHLLSVCRYVEANPLRAKLVRRAEAWEFSSLRWWPGGPKDGAAADGGSTTAAEAPVPLAAWPVPRPSHWAQRVNRPPREGETERLRTSLRRGRPYGDDAWARRTARALGLEHTFRDPGRPRKTKPEAATPQ